MKLLDTPWLTPVITLASWVTLFTATVLEWRWEVAPSFGGPRGCTVADLCDAAEAVGQRQMYTRVAWFAFGVIVVLELLRAIRASPLSPEAELRRRFSADFGDGSAAASGRALGTSTRRRHLPGLATPRAPHVMFGIAVVAGLCVLSAGVAGFLFFAAAIGGSFLAGEVALVVVAFALARLNGAVLQAVWTWCPRRISVTVGLAAALLAVAAPLPVIFTDGARGRFCVVALAGCLTVLGVGAVWGRSMPRD